MSKTDYSLQMAVYAALAGKEIIQENKEISLFLDWCEEGWVMVGKWPSKKGPGKKGPAKKM